MPRARRPLIDRLIDNIIIDDDCWEWGGQISSTGYGVIFVHQDDGKRGNYKQAHREVYEWLVGPIPDGLHLDHLCMNTKCVRPDHLEPVTPKENTHRYLATVPRITHCRRGGHEYTEANTYWQRGRRICRTCVYERNRQWRVRQRLEHAQ